MKKVLVTDAVDKKCVGILEAAGCEVKYQPGMARDLIEKEISNYNGLIVRSETKVNSELISLMNSMEVIGRAGTGVDNIDVEAATRKGIVVMNTPGGNTISTAEHSMALIVSLCRNIAQANQSMRAGKWDKKSYKGTELQDKTLGVVGFGRIGREVAIRSKAFGMSVIAYDPVVSEELAHKAGVALVDINSIFERSDIITFHVPLNDETKYMISEETLKKCKDGVKIINCARGGIVDQDALLNALESGKVSGAALDVYEKEPPDLTSKLIQHPKLLATPHLGASTEEAQEKVAVQIAEQMAGLFQNKSVRGIINAAAIGAEGNKEIAPYVRLAENIGILHSQLIRDQLKQININFSGELLHASSTLLSTAMLKGFLSRKVAEVVNFINAPYLAKEMGIVVNETKTGANSNYTNLLTVECETEKENRSLAGTVFGNNELRIVSIDSYHLELKPEGHMLFYSNIDKPGMLANVGKVLAEANINIAGLSLGRLEAGKEALTVINTDSEINKKVAEKILAINGVHKALTVKI
jgi:D-3-phosphoglycerate dehydrogenase / 2-oxoglutarate reductase